MSAVTDIAAAVARDPQLIACPIWTDLENFRGNNKPGAWIDGSDYIPPATLADARKMLVMALDRNKELSERATKLAAALRAERLYLERALEGVKNTEEKNVI
jgi:hypothetical protein